MYSAKELIGRMRKIAGLDSNIELARYFKVSYNTLNTWLKRNKLPQEVILEFAKKNGCSLDYLIFNKVNSISSIKNKEEPKITEFPYFGEYEPLKIGLNSVIKLDTDKIFSGGYYLCEIDNIIFIAQAKFDPFNKTVLLKNSTFEKKITMEKFNTIKKGLIVSVKNNNL